MKTNLQRSLDVLARLYFATRCGLLLVCLLLLSSFRFFLEEEKRGTAAFLSSEVTKER